MKSLFSCVFGEEEIATGKLKMKRMSDGEEFATDAEGISEILSGQKAKS